MLLAPVARGGGSVHVYCLRPSTIQPRPLDRHAHRCSTPASKAGGPGPLLRPIARLPAGTMAGLVARQAAGRDGGVLGWGGGGDVAARNRLPVCVHDENLTPTEKGVPA